MMTTAGEVTIEIPYCQLTEDDSWVSPVREAWGLEPCQRMTPELEERLTFTAAKTFSYESAAQVAACWGSPASDDSTIHRHVQKVGTRAREEEEGRERASETPALRDEIVRLAGEKNPPGSFSIVIMMDGWMARERGPQWGLKPAEILGDRVCWHEMKTAIIFRVEHRAQTAGGRRLIIEKAVVAHQGEWGGLARKLVAEALRCGLKQAKEVFIVGDGGTWIWKLKAERFAHATGVLDFFHGSENLWGATGALYGRESEEAKKWIEPVLHMMRHGQEEKALQAIKGLEEKALALDEGPKKIISNTIRYFDDHRHHIHYEAVEKRGCPIGSGAMESTCSQLQSRLKRTGQFWTEEGKRNLLSLQLAHNNGDWDDLWVYRPEQN